MGFNPGPRPHLDYGDTTYDQAYSGLLTGLFSSIQLSISYYKRYKRDIKEKIYQEQKLSIYSFGNP